MQYTIYSLQVYRMQYTHCRYIVYSAPVILHLNTRLILHCAIPCPTHTALCYTLPYSYCIVLYPALLMLHCAIPCPTHTTGAQPRSMRDYPGGKVIYRAVY
jgi:hypothetical protein